MKITAPSVLLVVLARNGAGKGTVLKILKQIGLIQVHGMSDILRGIQTHPEVGPLVTDCLGSAKRVPCEIVAEAFRKHCIDLFGDTEHPIHAFDGACRTAEQVILKMRWVRENFPNLKIVFVELLTTHKVAMGRVKERREKMAAAGLKPREDDEPQKAEGRSMDYDQEIGLIRVAIEDMCPGQPHQIAYDNITPTYAAAQIYNLLFPEISADEALRIIEQHDLAVA